VKLACSAGSTLDRSDATMNAAVTPRALVGCCGALALSCSAETPAPSTSDGGAAGLEGGASAAVVCPEGQSYGSPLEGMGAVVTIGAPATGPVTSFAYLEGPVWIASLGRLFFSDIAASPQPILSLTPSTAPELFVADSGSNGLAIDGHDQLIVADQPRRRITRVDPETATVSAELVRTGNVTPNDLIVRSDGNIYLTDPFVGLFRVDPAGALTGPFPPVRAPNGVVLSPDEMTLYVGDVFSLDIYALPLAEDGAVDTSGVVLAKTVGTTLDGMAVDCAGNLYATTSKGVEVFTPTGASIGTIETGASSNATFGGADRKTLYVTAITALRTVSLAVPGLPD
jgi:gluconolactonase